MSKGNPKGKVKPDPTDTTNTPAAPILVKDEPGSSSQPVSSFDASFGEWSSKSESTTTQPGTKNRLASFLTKPTHKPRPQDKPPVPNPNTNVDVIFPTVPPPPISQSLYAQVKREPNPSQSSLAEFISHPTAVPPKPKTITPRRPLTTADIPPIAEQLKIDPTNTAHPTTVPFWNYKKDQDNVNDLGEASMNIVEGEDMRIVQRDGKFQLTLATKNKEEVANLLKSGNIDPTLIEQTDKGVAVSFSSEEDLDKGKTLFNDKFPHADEIRQKKRTTVKTDTEDDDGDRSMYKSSEAEENTRYKRKVVHTNIAESLFRGTDKDAGTYNGTDELVFIQLPSQLPFKPLEPSSSSTSAVPEELASSKNPLTHVPDGNIGKLFILKSGKVKMKLGDVVFDVSQGMPCAFLQELAAVDGKRIVNLGPLDKRMVVTPDIDHL